METEYEVTFIEVNKDKIRERLGEAGVKLVRPEFLQKRIVFSLPRGHKVKGGWLRIRDEGDKITMSLKAVDGDKIENQKEVSLKINDLQKAELLLTVIGCQRKAYQESKRELWLLNDVEVTIDEWPFLEPSVEIEGKSEELVKKTAKELGFDYSKALFCSIDFLYNKKYGVSLYVINNKTPCITFDGANPLI